MKKRGGPTGLRRADRSRFPYEPRVVGGKLMSPVELQRLHRFIPGETVFFARMQDADSLCRNLTATGHHSALS
jgi:hypothetical protein